METKRKSAKVVVSVLALAGLAVFSLFAVGGSLEPFAPPGPTMKTLDEVEPRIPIHASDLPLFITEPNSYYLAEDIHFTSTANRAITIECNDVTIDLMGYTLKGPDSGPWSGIYMYGRANVEVRNGTVRDFFHAIQEKFSTGKEHRVIGLRAISNLDRGIYLFGYGHLVKDCTVADNGSNGIYAAHASTITGNTCYKNGYHGISTLDGSQVSANTCYENSQDGIYAGSGSTVSGNTAYENQSHGINAGTGCTIIGNTARLNTGNGIDFNGLGTVADNTADRNSGYGIRVTSGAVVARNSCAENTLDGIKASTGNRIVGNDCGGNGNGGDGAGIHVTSLRNVIESNTVLLNDRGIDVDSTRNFIAKNTATMNTTDYDIAANNAYGPIVDVTSVGDISGTANANHPWANFEF